MQHSRPAEKVDYPLRKSGLVSELLCAWTNRCSIMFYALNLRFIFFVCVSAVGNVFKIGSLDNCPVHNEYEKKPKEATEHPS